MDSVLAINCLINPEAILIGGRLPALLVDQLATALNDRMAGYSRKNPLDCPGGTRPDLRRCAGRRCGNPAVQLSAASDSLCASEDLLNRAQFTHAGIRTHRPENRARRAQCTLGPMVGGVRLSAMGRARHRRSQRRVRRNTCTRTAAIWRPPRRARVQPRQIFAFAQGAALQLARRLRASCGEASITLRNHYRRADGLFRTLVAADGSVPRRAGAALRPGICLARVRGRCGRARSSTNSNGWRWGCVR